MAITRRGNIVVAQRRRKRFSLASHEGSPGFSSKRLIYWRLNARLSGTVAQTEGSAALMTVLRDFIDEIGRELDARGDKALAPHHWLGFVKLLADIDQDDRVGALRQRMEQVVSQRNLRFQDRCLALIPLLNAEPAIAKLFNRRRRAAIAAVAAQ